ncbi:MAG: nucleotidyltransferase domain-containing protein [Bacteroidaceae bacterium]|nr:nucleotidyltransferase domain-containing protein [Bacteroidaceae bacterium]MBR6590694.1 nucleotidyltransferase domain-containing protein [Bacteroidaceae bacterium]
MKSRTEYMELLRSYFENTAKQYGVSRMGIFGSVARGEQGEQSDVDVAYEGKPDLLLRIRMKMDLEKLFGCNVDLVRLRKQLAGSFFEEEVTRDLMYV